jgi:hypothetical protein
MASSMVNSQTALAGGFPAAVSSAAKVQVQLNRVQKVSKIRIVRSLLPM